jgi:hypothetical protein
MIYLICDGDYSDKSNVGYFTTLEEAEKYCAVHNTYIEETELIQADFANITVNREYVFGFSIKYGPGSGWGPVYYCGEKRKVFCRCGLDLPSPKDWGVTVYVTADTRDRAEKIAQDIFAEFKQYVADASENNNTSDARRSVFELMDSKYGRGE